MLKIYETRIFYLFINVLTSWTRSLISSFLAFSTFLSLDWKLAVLFLSCSSAVIRCSLRLSAVGPISNELFVSFSNIIVFPSHFKYIYLQFEQSQHFFLLLAQMFYDFVPLADDMTGAHFPGSKNTVQSSV